MNVKIVYHLYDIRMSKKISSQKLSDLSGVGKTTINDIENYRHDPTIKTICMLAEALKTSPEALYSYFVK